MTEVSLPPPEPAAHPLSLEAHAKHAAAIIAALYAIGLMITNIHLGQFGIADFAILRSRFVLVGVCFLVYLLAPAVPFALSTLTLMFVTRLHHMGAPRAATVALSAAAVFSAAASAVLIPIACHYFVVLGPIQSRLDLMAAFWSLYDHPIILPYWSFVPGVVLAILISARFKPLARAMVILRRFRWFAFFMVLTGAVSQIVPFTWYVFPRVRAAVGGAQPDVVHVVLTDEGRLAVKEWRATQITGDERELSGELMLWHQTDDMLILTPIVPSYDRVPVLWLARDQVAAFWIRRREVLFERGVLTAVSDE